MRAITEDAFAALICDRAVVLTGGFGCCGHPDVLTAALQNRFLLQGSPRDLTLLFAAGQGDKAGKGLDRLAINGLISKAIGGFWGFCPQLTKMALNGEIEGHNWPQGVISKLFSCIASGSPGLLSHVGLDTFVDPDIEGGVIGGRHPTMVKKLNINDDSPLLLYPSIKIDFALLRGTYADESGNISMQDEISFMDGLAQAQATKNSGGLVIVQVKDIVPNGSIHPHQVKIPSFLVDYVVVANEEDHPQTYGTHYDFGYTNFVADNEQLKSVDAPVSKQIIASRAALILKDNPGCVANLGIGIPAFIGMFAKKLGVRQYTLTIESGNIGGIPEEGLSFGASIGPQAVIDQASLFDFYDGGGLDLAFLGFGEVDKTGNVNVSKFSNRLPGAGGFINISQNTKQLIFCGQLTADGSNIDIESDGSLKLISAGQNKKFVKNVSQITFNGQRALSQGKKVSYVTEYGVFELNQNGMLLTEIYSGIGVRDIIDVIDMPVRISNDLITSKNLLL